MLSLDNQSSHQHALKTLEEADTLLARMPQLAIDEVHTIEKVVPEWLAKVLGNQVSNAVIVNISIVNAHEGMTSRHKWRLEWNKEGQQAGLPTAIFIKATPKDPYLLQTLAVLHMGELEVHLYNELQKELGDHIPVAYYARSFPGGRFIIILEDLEERGIKPYWIKDTCSIDHARATAIALANIHSRFWNSERFNDDLSWVRPRSRRIGELWLRMAFKDSRERFLASELGRAQSMYMQDLIRQWNQNCMAVYHYWETKPQTLLHGDSHLGNSLEYKDGAAGYYDWQCLFRGYGYRDLAYFVMSALNVTDCKAHQREIFNLYTDTLEQNGKDITINRKEAWLDYCIYILDGLDATITSLMNGGGYGHAQSALLRQLATITAVVEEHDVAILLQRVVDHGSV